MFVAAFFKAGAPEPEALGAVVAESVEKLAKAYIAGFDSAGVKADGKAHEVTTDCPRYGQTIIILPVDPTPLEDVIRQRLEAGWRPTLADERQPELPLSRDQRVPAAIRAAARMAREREDELFFGPPLSSEHVRVHPGTWADGWRLDE